MSDTTSLRVKRNFAASYQESQHNEKLLFLDGPDSHDFKIMFINCSRA